MAALVRQAREDIAVRETAMALVGHLASKDWDREVGVVYGFVRDSIRYVRDVRGVETVATPVRTLEYRQGDCDDQDVLLAALLESIGYRTRFKAIGFAPGHYSHVYVQVQRPRTGDWVSLDPTEPVGVGWEPAGARAVMTQEV